MKLMLSIESIVHTNFYLNFFLFRNKLILLIIIIIDTEIVIQSETFFITEVVYKCSEFQ